MKNRSLILLCLTFSLLTAIGFAQEKKQEKPVEVILLHANDMHAKIDNMAKLAYLADSLKRFHDNVFLLAAGDNFTGNPIVDMAPDKGSPMIDLMNRCGFSVSAMGNHEFDMGQEFLHKRFLQATFPFICSNLNASGAVIGPVKPYLILGTKSGDSIALLGLLQLDDNGLPSSIPTHMMGISFVNGLSKAREYAWLKTRYGNLIALSHLGIEDDTRLADSLPQLDLIIGGHSHTLLEKPRMENGVMIVQAGSYLKYIGKTTLMVSQGHIVDRRDEVIAMESLHQEKKEIRNLIDQYNSNTEFDKVVGLADQPLEGVDELGSLMTDAVVSQSKADIAFQNKGGIRLPSLPAGKLTLRDVYKLDPFNNQIVLFNMNVAEIKSLICYGYKHEKAIDLQVSGITYLLTGNGNNQCARVDLFDKSGKPLDPQREFSVAMNSYMAAAYKFDHKDPGTITQFTTNEALVHYLHKVKRVNYSGVRRATLGK
ncbi:MAG: bifunctional UDP-sugar hydrolase/5'-nucleotidase [Bacteroidota bacterium]